ncbi:MULTISPECIES: heat shock protein transcriptional repressor HspR [Campylobacter]|jgi:putative heat shock protein hspR|uniref:Heat shock transcriptional regulator, MerR family n=1 Tax=Campylobacter curvus (strain 525.92) TaxID=360105 RepID=A7GYW1_CAMC5|nr:MULTISPECIES: helix-turn-helix transcriptional regulator [Campylobacter]EAU00305.1 heat shock transcriptional regulator, MerR family [Campylobacter curvus 525.92]EJP74411.1 heat shock protein HspR family protein [Campylobacter sp. FOBRC14]MBN7288424.1 helix-turn-helix transcriptional regulator [Campylobacter curvus]MDU6827371.1 helix-turn-helix transcriptional regulator [Campylobacter sp.]QKF61392.1 heat shock transcriptional regulator, MerR family [Campylobacter curvus]
MQNYEEPVYLISVVAKVLSIHPQTLRQYEREGLIEPSRTDGRMRLYSQKDVDRVKMILRLTRDLGVNLAGVDVILQLKEKMDEFEATIDELKEQLNKSKQSAIPAKKSLVKHKNSFDLIFYEGKK